MNLEILKKEIELNSRFNIVKYNIVSMRVFNLEVNIEISYGTRNKITRI